MNCRYEGGDEDKDVDEAKEEVEEVEEEDEGKMCVSCGDGVR